jgi:hypothetical protein
MDSRAIDKEFMLILADVNVFDRLGLNQQFMDDETSQIFFWDAHILPKLFGINHTK